VIATLLAIAPQAAAARPPAAGSLAQRSNVPGLTAARYADAFVTRRGSRLYVDGRRFRFGGANGESLGLRNYGPILSVGQRLGSERYPTKFEIDDELATLHEMGATVVRAQTIGDTVGCAVCLEPKLGVFNARAFAEMDLVVVEARRYGIKLIGEFAGDANGTEPYGPPTPGAVVGNASTDWYCAWRHISQTGCETATFEDPRVLGDYERHMRAVLDHVNPRTGLAYKDDPTFAGWVDGNNLWLLNPTPLSRFEHWLRQVSSYFKALDHQQLFIDISAGGGDYLPPKDTFGLGPNEGRQPVAGVLNIPGVDLYGQEWYPKDFPALDPHSPAGTQIHVNAAAIAKAGKAYATIEYGWDHYNYASQSVLRGFLAGLVRDRNISGELFWELASHANGSGWQAIPANEHCQPTCAGLVEDGSWWALYYTGRTTASNTAADMAARAQIMRSAAYRMAGFTHAPAHERPPAAIITSTRGARVVFEGSAGARRYSVQKLVRGHWITRCHTCTTDAGGGWQDPAGHPGCYRVIAYNLAGRPAPASRAVGACSALHQSARPAFTALGSRAPWVAAWSSPSVNPGTLAPAVPLYSGTGGRTVRNVVHITLGGSLVRVRLSNVFGNRPATFSDVRVALRSAGAGIVAATSRRLHFAGHTSVTVGVGRELTSDPVRLSVRAGQDLAISIYAPSATGDVTAAGILTHTNYISGAGDLTGAGGAGSFPETAASWYWIDAVDVRALHPDSGAVVAIGDSITAGYNSTPNANRGWVDLLAARLRAGLARPHLSVLNAGIGGNNLHESTRCFGQSALARMKRDVFEQSGIRDVILDEGANDITHPTEPRTAPLYPCLAHRRISARGMIALFKRAIVRIHARHLRVIGVTISPFGRYGYWTPAIEAERQAINHWIRTTHAFDGTIDFDRVLRDPTHPTWLRPSYDSGDHLHPNNAGHAAMARSIRLSLFA
jgi:lysophospholipase L1-like esterase